MLGDISTLIEKAVVGRTYTMVLKVTSTCEKPIEIGFNGRWFVSYAPPNAKGSTITVTDKWQGPSKWHNLRLESRTACAGKSLTIHNIQFVEGSKVGSVEGLIVTKGKYSRISCY